MAITAKQMIEILGKCHPDAIVMREADQWGYVPVGFVEFLPLSNWVLLQTVEPDLIDTNSTCVEILDRDECFAETKYYHVKTGIAY